MTSIDLQRTVNQLLSLERALEEQPELDRVLLFKKGQAVGCEVKGGLLTRIGRHTVGIFQTIAGDKPYDARKNFTLLSSMLQEVQTAFSEKRLDLEIEQLASLNTLASNLNSIRRHILQSTESQTVKETLKSLPLVQIQRKDTLLKPLKIEHLEKKLTQFTDAFGSQVIGFQVLGDMQGQAQEQRGEQKVKCSQFCNEIAEMLVALPNYPVSLSEIPNREIALLYPLCNVDQAWRQTRLSKLQPATLHMLVREFLRTSPQSTVGPAFFSRLCTELEQLPESTAQLAFIDAVRLAIGDPSAVAHCQKLLFSHPFLHLLFSLPYLEQTRSLVRELAALSSNALGALPDGNEKRRTEHCLLALFERLPSAYANDLAESLVSHAERDFYASVCTQPRLSTERFGALIANTPHDDYFSACFAAMVKADHYALQATVLREVFTGSNEARKIELAQHYVKERCLTIFRGVKPTHLVAFMNRLAEPECPVDNKVVIFNRLLLGIRDWDDASFERSVFEALSPAAWKIVDAEAHDDTGNPLWRRIVNSIVVQRRDYNIKTLGEIAHKIFSTENYTSERASSLIVPFLWSIEYSDKDRDCNRFGQLQKIWASLASGAYPKLVPILVAAIAKEPSKYAGEVRMAMEGMSEREIELFFDVYNRISWDKIEIIFEILIFWDPNIQLPFTKRFLDQLLPWKSVRFLSRLVPPNILRDNLSRLNESNYFPRILDLLSCLPKEVLPAAIRAYWSTIRSVAGMGTPDLPYGRLIEALSDVSQIVSLWIGFPAQWRAGYRSTDGFNMWQLGECMKAFENEPWKLWTVIDLLDTEQLSRWIKSLPKETYPKCSKVINWYWYYSQKPKPAAIKEQLRGALQGHNYKEILKQFTSLDENEKMYLLASVRGPTVLELTDNFQNLTQEQLIVALIDPEALEKLVQAVMKGPAEIERYRSLIALINDLKAEKELPEQFKRAVRAFEMRFFGNRYCNFTRFSNSPQFSDIKICFGCTEVYAHKVLLQLDGFFKQFQVEDGSLMRIAKKDEEAVKLHLKLIYEGLSLEEQLQPGVRCQLEELVKPKVPLELFFDKKDSLSDIRVSADERSIHAHSVILVSAMEYFESLLRTPMKETLAGEIKVDVLSYDIIHAVLYTIYSGQAPTDFDKPEHEEAFKAAMNYFNPRD